MALAAGTHFGPYEIVESIGAGGMGEVYRATDTKLGRDVAIKTLPTALAQEPDRLARFEREAKLLATLNHAHIGAIYGLDEHEGTQFIAMELIEGETLEEKLKDGPLPVQDGLEIALQIAEALEAAHEKGVVHRDLKPANIMLTRDGVVKVLDFGLAKAFLGDPNDASPAHSPALSMAMTQQGLILGTAGYMSPEQASGQATDQRADVWAFGVVLYEMLTGLPLFSGESVPHVLAAVLQTEPDWNRLPKDLHPRLLLLLKHCLKKRVRDRYHSIADVRIDIEEILNDPQGVSAPMPRTEQPPAPKWRRAISMTALLIAAIGITGLAVSIAMRQEPQSVSRFAYTVPAGQVFRQMQTRVLAISPDGRQFVYNTTDGIYLRPMSELELRLIPGTEQDLTSPSFSPDSQAVAYYDGFGLKRISISGAAPVVITSELSDPWGMSWEADGTILFGQTEGIYRVPATGGSPELIIPADDGTFVFRPSLLPDGDTVLFSTTKSVSDWDSGSIVAQSLSTGERTVLIEGGGAGRYVSPNHLVYAFGNGLFGVAFDPDSLTVSGGAVPLVQGITQLQSFGLAANFDISDNGTLIYASGAGAGVQRTLAWVDRDGRESPLSLPPRNYVKPRISPDGELVALDARDQELDIWIWNLARETLTRLTFDSSEDENPIWSPDSRMIAFSSARDDGTALDNNLYWQAADGTGSVELLAEGNGQIFPTSFLPDGSGILTYGTAGGRSNANDDIAFFRFDDEATAMPLLDSTFAESYPAVSPDGQWLAYVSDESGREEIYVRTFPDVDAGRWQVSSDGGTQPMWSHSGRELFYRDGENLVTVSVQTEPRFSTGNPEVLFEDTYILEQGGPNYDVSPDDDRFLMIKGLNNASERAQIVIVENWFEELKQLVPTD